MSGVRFFGNGNRPPRAEKSKHSPPVSAKTHSNKQRKADWEAKVRASFVTDVVRGPSGAKVASKDEADIAKAMVQGAAGLAATSAKRGLVTSTSSTALGESTGAAEAQPGRRRLASIQHGSRENWEAQVRASFVTDVVRGPMDANCGKTTYDGARLGNSGQDGSKDDLGFLAGRREIASKVDRTELEIAGLLEEIRNDLVSRLRCINYARSLKNLRWPPSFSFFFLKQPPTN